MLNLVKDTFKKNISSEAEIGQKLTQGDIEKFYLSGIKSDFKIGLEYERLSLDKNTFKNATYDKLENIIKRYCEITSWKIIYDKDTAIGASSSYGSSISLEPGCQLEISLAPQNDILLIESELTKICKLLDDIAQSYNVMFLGYGISPVSSVDEIDVLKKERYLLMTKYLPECSFGELSLKMMRKTAGMQVNIDYSSKDDAYLKLKFLNLIMPFVCGLLANSSFEKRITDKKSSRANIWRYTGKERCNFFYKDIFSKFFAKKDIFKNYIESILNVPMIFIERNNKLIEINGKINFKEFLKNGYLNYKPTMEDYILHQSLCFPDIRLKKYIEIRNHDSADVKTALALCVFYQGLMKANINQLISNLKCLKLEQIEKYNQNIIEQGLEYKIDKNTSGWNIVEYLLKVSISNLSSIQKTYIKPLSDIVKQRKTKSDLIIDYGIKTAKDLVEFLY